MTIKEKIKRHRRIKAAKKDIRNVYDTTQVIAEDIIIALSDVLEEAKQSVGCDQKEDD